MRYYYMMEYLPVRHEGTAQQIAARRAVWDFKDGSASESILSGLAARVRTIVGGNRPSDYVICFVPASTASRTESRYAQVARELERRTGVKATLSAVRRIHDGLPGHIAGKSADPSADFSFDSSSFRGKNVILVDDVITRGRTLSCTGTRLLSCGAETVTGLVVAKTVNPDWAA